MQGCIFIYQTTTTPNSSVRILVPMFYMYGVEPFLFVKLVSEVTHTESLANSRVHTNKSPLRQIKACERQEAAGRGVRIPVTNKIINNQFFKNLKMTQCLFFSTPRTFVRILHLEALEGKLKLMIHTSIRRKASLELPQTGT